MLALLTAFFNSKKLESMLDKILSVNQLRKKQS